MSSGNVPTGVIPAQAGIQSLLEGLVVAAKAGWIPSRAALGRNDGGGKSGFETPRSILWKLKIAVAFQRRAIHLVMGMR